MFILQAVCLKVCRDCFTFAYADTKRSSFLVGVTEVTRFQTLKDKMTTRPVLILPDLQKSFEVYCDACGRSFGAVLMQEGRIIAYESRMFSKPKMTAQIYEKELLAVIHALTQWRHYLLGADFTVSTDHQSLRYLSRKQLSEKQIRWANSSPPFPHWQQSAPLNVWTLHSPFLRPYGPPAQICFAPLQMHFEQEYSLSLYQATSSLALQVQCA
ncbi:hypothetical protein L7F22_046256 [Adiantum nelumboides]|nr:hypothetical protein [Adiantum nelumboides]